MFLLSFARNVLSLRRIASVIVLISLFSNHTLAAPEAITNVYNSVVDLKEDVKRVLVAHDFGMNIFTFDAMRTWLAKLGNKRPIPDRIVIGPVDESGSLSVMQGERVTFSATGYSGDEALNGIAFTWTAQDTARLRPVRALNGAVFQANRPGVFVVTAAAETGQQAEINVTVNVNEGYGIQRLMQKRDSDRTSQERQGIATMMHPLWWRGGIRPAGNGQISVGDTTFLSFDPSPNAHTNSNDVYKKYSNKFEKNVVKAWHCGM